MVEPLSAQDDHLVHFDESLNRLAFCTDRKYLRDPVLGSAYPADNSP
jgi:hypothetical protein